MDLLRGIMDSKTLMNSRELITIVGAGGKTSTVFIMAKELKALGKRVLVTTTTKIYKPEEKDYDRLYIGEKSPGIEKEGTSSSQQNSGGIVVWGSNTCKEGKLWGLKPERIDEVWKSQEFSWIIVEGDGARGKNIKAPKEDEPVIPFATTMVIGVIGMKVLGKPVVKSQVHRLELFQNVTRAKEGELIHEEMLRRLILHKQGLFKGTPGHAKTLLLLNQCEDRLTRNRALSLGESLGVPFMVTSLQNGLIYGGKS